MLETRQAALLAECEAIASNPAAPAEIRDNIGASWLSVVEGKTRSRDQLIGGAALRDKTRIGRLFSDISEAGNIEGRKADYIPATDAEVKAILPEILAYIGESDAVKLESFMRGEKLDACPRQHNRKLNKLIAIVGAAIERLAAVQA